MNWLDIEINEKIYKRIALCGILLIIIFTALFAASSLIPRVYTLDDDVIIDDEGTIKNGISKLNIGSKIIEIEGWAYHEGESVDSYECYFILKNHSNGKMYKLKTIKKEVETLMYVDDTYNCLNCGMYSKNLILGIKKDVYELYILYKNNGENILTNTGLGFEI